MRKINSFSRRTGKGFSLEDREFVEKNISQFLFEPSKMNPDKKYILEIGFGTGEHLIDIAINNPDHIIIGVETFLSGVQKALYRIIEKDIKNIRLYHDDIDLIINNIPEKSIDKVYILFPDPWPKKRHNKRRIINEEKLDQIDRLLKNNGIFIIASDHKDYQEWIEQKLLNHNRFKRFDKYTNNDYNHADEFWYEEDKYKPTKYHKKAMKNGDIANMYINR